MQSLCRTGLGRTLLKVVLYIIHRRLPRPRSCLLAPVSHDTSRGSGRQEDTGPRKDIKLIYPINIESGRFVLDQNSNAGNSQRCGQNQFENAVIVKSLPRPGVENLLLQPSRRHVS